MNREQQGYIGFRLEYDKQQGLTRAVGGSDRPHFSVIEPPKLLFTMHPTKTIKSSLQSLALAAGILVASNSSKASVITFDDLGSYQNFSGVYQGLNWGSDWYSLSSFHYATGYGNTYGAVSGQNAAFNGNGVTTMAVSSVADFDYNGAYFTGWSSNDSAYSATATSLTLLGYNNGNLLYTQNSTISAGSYNWVASSMTGIDELRIQQNNGNLHWWLVDNLTINESNNSVPDGGTTFALLGFALGCLGLLSQSSRKWGRAGNM